MTNNTAQNTINVFGDDVDVSAIQQLLEDQFMLVSLRVRKGAKTRQDKSAAEKLEQDRGAKKGTYSVSGSLWGPKNDWSAQRVAEIHSAAAGATKVKEKYTRPWGNYGQGLLPNSSYFAFAEEMAAVQAQVDSLLTALEPHYDRLVAHARQSHGTAGATLLYPDWEAFKGGIGIDIAYGKVPAPEYTSDLNVEHSIASQFAEQAVAQRDAAISEIMRNVWESIGPKLERLINQTRPKVEGESKARIYRTLMEDTRSFVEAMGAFNITDDPAITRLQEKFRDAIANVDTDDLRQSPEVCADVHAKAKDVAQDLADMGFF